MLFFAVATVGLAASVLVLVFGRRPGFPLLLSAAALGSIPLAVSGVIPSLAGRAPDLESVVPLVPDTAPPRTTLALVILAGVAILCAVPLGFVHVNLRHARAVTALCAVGVLGFSVLSILRNGILLLPAASALSIAAIHWPEGLSRATSEGTVPP